MTQTMYDTAFDVTRTHTYSNDVGVAPMSSWTSRAPVNVAATIPPWFVATLSLSLTYLLITISIILYQFHEWLSHEINHLFTCLFVFHHYNRNLKPALTFLMVTVNSVWQPVQLRTSSLQTQQFVLRTLRSNDNRSAFFHNRLLSLYTSPNTAYSSSISIIPSSQSEDM